jgi:integrase
MAWSLYERTGERKYLSASERKKFREASKKAPANVQTLCWLLLDTGCRISEALALTGQSIDAGNGAVVIESLKKRRRGIYRSVPISPDLLNELILTHHLGADTNDKRLWPWHRMTAYRRIGEVMTAAEIKGIHATPKGLRHGFAIAALEAGVPLNLVQRWLGHADMATTAIYANAMGAEERGFASKMWPPNTDS